MFRRKFSLSVAAISVFAVALTSLPAMGATGTTSAAADKAPAADVWVPPADAASDDVPAPGAPDTPLPPVEVRTLRSGEGDAQRAPAGTPVGPPGLGALPYFGFEEVPLSTRTLARVNLGNGNLLLTSNDAVLTGPSLGVRNDRFYNGLSSAEGSFGGGWSSSLSNHDVRLDVVGTTATYTGANGFKAAFTKPGAVWVAPAGFNASLTLASGVYTLTLNKTGEKFTFNGSGRMLTNVDRNGVGTTYQGGSGGDIEQVFEASGRRFDIDWNSGYTRIDNISDSAGRTTGYLFDSADRLDRVTGQAGYFEEYDYDSVGRVSEARFADSGGAASKVVFGYDAQHRITSIKRGTVGLSTFVTTTTVTYAAGQTTVKDGRGNDAVYTIDSSGRVSGAKDALLRSRSQTWTANSDVATSTDAFASGGTPGNMTSYTYDALNNATSVTLPTGSAASATYATGTSCPGTGGTAFQPKCSSDSAGATKKFDYDANGNITGITDTTAGGTAAIPQRYSYHGLGGVSCGGFTGQVCTSTDGNNKVTSYSYDVDGNLTTVTPPAPQGATTYSYDSLGRVATVTDGRGDTSTYGYNGRGDLTSTTFQGGNTLITTYFNSGLKASDNDNVAGAKTYTWDVVGRLTAEDPPGGDALAYTYDANGNLTRYTDQNGSVKYTYDVANQLTEQIVGASVTCSVGAGSPAESNCVKFEYDANGAETKRTLPGNATIVTINDASGRKTRITAKDSAGVVKADVGYSYTAAGGTGPTADRADVQSRTSFAEQGVTAGAITSYGYDSLNRLKTATEKSGATTTASWAYSYDAAGNRTQQVRTGTTGATAGTINYTYNAANRITSTSADTSTWTYDGAGNQTRNGITGQTATYNSRQALTGIGATTYTAFGQGNTEQLSRSGGTTYTNAAAFGLLSEVGSAGAGSVRTYTKTQAGDTVQVRFGNGGRYYYVTDHLGSVLGSFDKFGAWQGGYSYSPYGEARFTAGTTAATSTSLRYIGGYFDSGSGLYKLGARYYDASIGRFTQYDPSGQEASPYFYAGGDPVNNIDPSGLAYDIAAAAGDVANFTGAGAGIGGVIGCGIGFFGAGAGCVPVAGAGAVVGGVAGALLGLGYAAGYSVGGGYDI